MRRLPIALPLASATFALATSLPAQTLVRSVNGPAANARFGTACVVVHDQNSDGFKDVLVGAPGFNQERGAIYCVSGGFLASGNGGSILWSLAPSANQGDNFGAALADMGDLTGDGVGDFLVGQPGYDTASMNDVGAVRLVNGASHSLVSLIHGIEVGSGVGSALGATGDIDYDLMSEVVIGAPAPIGTTARVYAISGFALVNSAPIGNLLIGQLSLPASTGFGSALTAGSEIFDFGQTAASIFYVGAPGYDVPGGVDAGCIFRAALVTNTPPSISAQYSPGNAGEHFGSSLDAAHDYNGDTWIDIVVGAPDATNSFGGEAGRATVVSELAILQQTPPYELSGFQTYGGGLGFDYHYGAAVQACEDLNGDGVGEILVGAPDYMVGLNRRGSVSLLSGATATTWSSIGGSSNEQIGGAFAGAVDDLDGDGFKEFVFTGPRADNNGTDSGVLKCYRLFPVAPLAYCSGKVNSLGCTPAIDFSGAPSATSSAPFLVTATNFVNQKSGLLFYSRAPAAVVFQGGTKCVANPTIRTFPQNSGGGTSGASCTGTYSIDFNAWLAAGIDPSLGAGSEIYAQYWSRDPQTASHTGLSNALRFVINP